MVESIHIRMYPQVKQNKVISRVTYLINSICEKKSRGGKSFCVGAKARAGAGAVIRISGPAEPEPKEIFTAPQHWLLPFRLER
jgi:hypothetical protein